MRAWHGRYRRALSEALHAALAVAALAAAFLLRLEFAIGAQYGSMLWRALPWLLAAKLAVFRAFALRDLAWRDIGFEDLMRLATANLAASLAATGLIRVALGGGFPRSICVLDGVLCLVLMAAARAVARRLCDWRRAGEMRTASRRIFIYGAGRAGRILLAEIRRHPEIGYSVAGFFDDDPHKRDRLVNGVRVLGNGGALAEIARRQSIGEGLLALPSASGAQLAAILEQCRAAQVSVKRIPPLAELVSHGRLVEQIREVRLEDLLGRPPVECRENSFAGGSAGKIVLVTGAGGSIGGELCRQIARLEPRALIGLDQAETALYQIEQEMRERFPQVVFHPAVGDIQNGRRLAELFRAYRPDVVYHAAAYKHVPMMEAHLFEAIENNVFGTCNLAAAAMSAGVETFVLISSDKAVRPANVMGASKRLAELVCLAAGASAKHTRFLAVRFGNVLGSSGSVIPLFQRQIASGGPVTVTHPEMRRFFMTIPEAAQLVLQAAALETASPGPGGKIFVLNMGEPVQIVDLARKMILLNGLRPGKDIRIEFTGVRPGEKLYEELSAYEEDTFPTSHAGIRVFLGKRIRPEQLAFSLKNLRSCVETRDAPGVLECIKDLVPGYHPSESALRRASEETPRHAVAGVGLAG